MSDKQPLMLGPIDFLGGRQKGSLLLNNAGSTGAFKDNHVQQTSKLVADRRHLGRHCLL
jgi:hypothetical protein